MRANGHPLPAHTEPRLLVTIEHDGRSALAGCQVCADPAVAAPALQHLADRLTHDPLADVRAERARQDVRWGRQDHHDGTGPGGMLFGIRFEQWADRVRHDVDRAARERRSAWAGILLEEVFEALAEDDPVKLRAELVQVAAVAVQWVQAIDRRHP